MISALFISHRGERCGVYQFGRRLYTALAASPDIAWHYAECDGPDELLAAARATAPRLVLFNYHPSTLGWATDPALRRLEALSFSVFHEVHQEAADALVPQAFDYFLCPDPTLVPRNPIALAVPRFIPPLVSASGPEPSVFTVGSFGFATAGKGFERLCALVNEQLDTARVRINIPRHDSDAMTPHLEAIVVGCHREISKPGVRLEITHDFLDEDGLLRFLTGNTMNAFLYDETNGRGLSSCTDYALSCGRPIAISRSSMFRHLHGVNPSICAEDRALATIAAAGTASLMHHRTAYLPATASVAWNRAILDALRTRAVARSVPDGRGFNKILDDRSRETYTVALADLRTLAPEIIRRKIARANIQQAFGLDTLERLAPRFHEPRILAVGSYEDTTVAALRAKGFRLDEIDPNVNGLDLEQFYCSARGLSQSYDLILSISVLEHVPDDRAFVRILADLLAPDGIAILTVDFSERYPDLGKKPAADWRLYTSADLGRLMTAIPDCALLDTPSWHDGADDFEYEGCHYSFASWVFRRLGTPATSHARAALIREGGSAWKETLGEHRRIIDDVRSEVATLRLGLEATSTPGNRHGEILERLVKELRFEEGPPSLRLVLPLARVIRTLKRGLVGARPEASGGVPASVPAVPVPLAPPPLGSSAPGPVDGLPRPVKALLRPIYRYGIRPLMRPLAWRARNFLLAEIRHELAQVRHALDEQGRLGARPDGVVEARLARTVEAALLTLTLDRRLDQDH